MCSFYNIHKYDNNPEIKLEESLLLIHINSNNLEEYINTNSPVFRNNDDKENFYIALLVCSKNPDEFQNVSDELKNDRKFIIELLSNEDTNPDDIFLSDIFEYLKKSQIS